MLRLVCRSAERKTVVQLGRLLTFHVLVANEQGSFTTPSFVSFTDEERLIGEAAKNQAAMNPRNTIFDIKYVLLLTSYSRFILARRGLQLIVFSDVLLDGDLTILRLRKTSNHGLSRS